LAIVLFKYVEKFSLSNFLEPIIPRIEKLKQLDRKQEIL
jgi:hypothetical protein